ncbi:MAG: hypothetical protein COW65_03105 [Cytophagales bacterium CG18_big_fil_WC_8_21_14_2_50_42_9]|nr:MAG: hypothetical protein COW65_03105 [Cytophagales bacterium CG18_big_fil_WC_8_21_14_2_50_42_9]
MSKKKNKKKKDNKNGSFYKSIKPFIKDSRVIYSILGAAGVGVALASAFGTDKGRSIVDSITGSLKNLGLSPNPFTSATSMDTTASDQQTIADKKVKTPRTPLES